MSIALIKQYVLLFKQNLLSKNSIFHHLIRQSHQTEPSKNILASYFSQIYDGTIREDDYQLKIVQSLQNLDNNLKHYKPSSSNQNVFKRIFTSLIKEQLSHKENDSKPGGLYLWGSVGCGKTFLMDLFYDNCSVLTSKKRVHFHRFMLDVHAEIHQIKTKKAESFRSHDHKNPIPTVAKLIASRSWLLCLDEFQVTDVADAMILKQLFNHLFNEGVILVATSNRCPDDLYKSGLQRSTFMPFIPLLKANCDVKCLDSNIDYRRSSKDIKKIYFLTSQAGVDTSLDNIFKVLAMNENDVIKPRRLNVNNREVILKKTCGRVADSDFKELCEQPLGADDYDKIGKVFHTVIIRNIPQLTIKKKSEAKRFITLIDMLYDARTRAIFSGDVPIEQLFNFKLDLEDESGHEEFSRKLLDDLGLEASEGHKLSLVTGEEEIFATDRTISRVIEMQTSQYWDMFGSNSQDKK